MSNIIVTGANRGLGLEFVKQLVTLSKSKNIFALCRNPVQAKELNHLANKNAKIKVIAAELTDFGNYKNILAEIKQYLENDGVNLLINNAGIMIKDNVNSITATNIMNTYKINSVAPLLLTQAFLPILKQANKENSFINFGKSLVLNISAQLGSVQENNVGQYLSYRLSKSALNMVTKTLSVELKSLDIFVLSIHPGWVKTDMGGEKAPLDTATSVSTMLKTTFEVTEEHRGGFLSYNGRKVLW